MHYMIISHLSSKQPYFIYALLLNDLLSHEVSGKWFGIFCPVELLFFVHYHHLLANFFFNFHVTLDRNKFLYSKTNQMHQFPKFTPAWNSTSFGQFLCPSSGVYSLYSRHWYVIQVCRQLSSRTRMELVLTIFILMMVRGTARNM